uniref:GPR180/TMEM145 transmembrane domain-containing protein n=1 Tax=Octactis speculum TaxID=3111310 RepID=A0A7S2AYQ2_9STRA
MCQNLSELLVISLLVTVSFGWTLRDGTHKYLPRIAATTVLLGLFQTALVFISRSYEDDFTTFHDHDHWPGVVLMVLRAAVSLVLWFGSRRIVKTARGLRSESAEASFVTNLVWAGMMWLLAYPATVILIVPLVPAYHRHRTVEASALFFQCTALGAMSVLFLGLGEAGKLYFEVSTLGSMGDLSLSHASAPDATQKSSGQPIKGKTPLRRRIAVE